MLLFLRWYNPDDVKQLIKAIKKNELFIGSTDTILGLMGQVNEIVFNKINYLKKRSKKPYIILADSLSKVSQLASIKNFPLESFLKNCWPGPVTVILPKKPSLPFYIGSEDTVALRIPNHMGLQAMLADLPFGLFSTSANITGQSVPTTVNEVPLSIKEGCAYVITDEITKTVKPSTIIDCTGQTMRVIREGAFSAEKLKQLWADAQHD